MNYYLSKIIKKKIILQKKNVLQHLQSKITYPAHYNIMSSGGTDCECQTTKPMVVSSRLALMFATVWHAFNYKLEY